MEVPSDEYLRTATLVMGDLLFQGRINFQIEVDYSGPAAPNSVIKAYNLTRDHRKVLDTKSPSIYLSAGYNGDNKFIFGGDLFYTETDRQGPDIITTLHMSRVLKPNAKAVVSISAATTDYQIYQACLQSLANFGIVKGLLSSTIKQTLEGGTYKGFSDINYASHFLQLICKRHNLHWNIHGQPPAVNLYSKNEYADGELIEVSAKTGMIGVPSISNDPRGYKIRHLLNGDLMPGKRVRITSIELPIPGEVRLSKSNFVGDTYEGDWYTEFEAQRLGGSSNPADSSQSTAFTGFGGTSSNKGGQGKGY